MKNKIRIISVIGLLIYSMSIFVVLLSIPASAVDQYNGKIYKYVGGSITVASTPVVSSLPAGTTYTVNTGTRQYNQLRITTETRAAGNSFEAYQSSTGSSYSLQVGDVLYFDRDIRDLSFTVAWRDFISNCCEPVAIWSSDDSSPYRSMYSTLSHYIFNDNFDDVPFGDMWITFAAVIGCLFIAGLPFLIVYWILRRI